MTKYYTNIISILNICKKPSKKSEIVSQMIYGDSFSVLKKYNQWIKIKTKEDNYIGYVKVNKYLNFIKPTHKVSVLKAKIFNSPYNPKKINEFSFAGLKEDKLTHDEENCIESLIKSLSAPRFIQVISNYSNMKDRELFEAEFIRATWDKPDLTSDEINLYINVCVDYINLKNIGAHIEKLNRMFEDADEQQDMTVRLAELLKTKSEEYNQCEKRQESLINRLTGDRAKRVAQRQDQNASILSLVESFQNEEGRALMVRMAEMQKIAVGEEANNLESMNEWKARILGISKNDIL